LPADKFNKLLSLIALCLGFFMVIIDVTIVNVALPTMAQNLNVGISALQWVVAGYALTFACLLLSAGNIGDRLGAKTAFLWGLALFVLTSLGCAMSSVIGWLTFFRFLQGAASALLVPTSLALISASYADTEERARAIGIWAAVGGLAGASGPVIGAVLTTWFGWRAVFYVNLPIGIIGFLLTLKYVLNTTSSTKSHFDFAGQLMGVVSIAALAFGLIEAGRNGWFAPIVISSFGIFIASLMAFLMIEKLSITPMLPLKFFRSSTFSASIAIGMILNMAAYGELFVLSFYFQQVRGYSVLMTGLALLPLIGMGVVGSYLGGRVASAIGAKLPIVIGLTMGAVGFIAMLSAGVHTPAYVILAWPLATIGFGASFTMPSATIAVINAVPDGNAGIASGAFNASRQIGSLLGTAIFGTIITASSHFVRAMHCTLIIGAVLYMCGSLMALIWIKKPIKIL